MSRAAWGGAVVYSRVLDADSEGTAEAVAAIRDDYPGHSVRAYRRTVSADGHSQEVTVVIVRERVGGGQ